VAACSKGVLYWNDEQHPLLEERQKAIGMTRMKLKTCEVCDKFCELSCPRLAEWTLNERYEAVSARSAGINPSGTPDGVIKALLVAAYSTEMIDGVVIPDIDPWTLEPVTRVATNVGEIVGGVGMQFLWTPILSALNEAIFEQGLTRIAVVGTPCVAEGVRQLVRAENPRLRPYQDAIRLTIAEFCTGIYMPTLIDSLLEQGMGIARHEIRGLTISQADGALTATLWDGTARVIPLTEVEPYTRHGCGSCNDYLGEAADIGVGAVGAMPGYSTLITHTPFGEVTVRNAIRIGLLETIPQVDEAALNTARAEKDRRARAQAFDKLRVLTLDALGDPNRQAQVRQQFINLYGKPGRKAKREDRNVVCSGC
jgi:coenzyme F420 hydrogenase subunit beta